MPSGSPLFANRLHWTITYLHQAGLLRRPRRAVVQITSRGLDVLADHPDRVDVGVLLQFAEFIEFRSRTRGDASTAQSDAQELAAVAETTPGETISKAVAEANSAVAAEVLERVRERERYSEASWQLTRCSPTLGARPARRAEADGRLAKGGSAGADRLTPPGSL